MGDSQSQDAASAGSGHPVKELSDGSTRFFLQRDQHLDQDQALDTSSVQTQQSVHPIQTDRKSTTAIDAKACALIIGDVRQIAIYTECMFM